LAAKETSVGQVFDLKTGVLAIGDPTMGLAQYSLTLKAGAYRLGPKAFRRPVGKADSAKPLIDLDSPCVFALDAAHVPEFKAWYHRVGNECSYMVLTLEQRLPEFEAIIGSRVGFYWEEEIAGENREGQYILDPAKIIKQAEPS
jgi:hypothetical protein